MIATSSAAAPMRRANSARTRSDSSKKWSGLISHGRALRISPASPAAAAWFSSGDILAQSK
jgi:hypothetical protein